MQRLGRRGAVLACLAAPLAWGQLSLGSISGHAQAGESVVVESKALGVSRSVRVGGDGSFQIGQLPSGRYVVTRVRGNGQRQQLELEVISSANSAVADFEPAAVVQQVVVTASGARRLDVRSTESSQVLTREQLRLLPTSKDVTSVALLAPSVVRADARLGSSSTRGGNTASIGGASAAENAYYVNGFNVTNLVNGLSFNQVPAVAIQSEEIKIGGFGAEFGRSLGGVSSVTLRRGTNEWHGGAGVEWTPGNWAGSSAYPDKVGNDQWVLRERAGRTDATMYTIWAGGPLVQDRVFAFGALQYGHERSRSYNISTQTDSVTRSPQYVVKLDWNVTDDNLFEFTSFNDRSRDTYREWRQVQPYQTARGDYNGQSWTNYGGANHIAQWTSQVTPDLSLRALYGLGVYDRASYAAGADCPVVVDARGATALYLGCSTGDGKALRPDARNTRNAWRLDLEWRAAQQHTLRFGLDNERYRVTDGTRYSGGYWYQVGVLGPGKTLDNGWVNTSAADVYYVSQQEINSGGTFKAHNAAWYLEDAFQVTRNVLVNLGLRNESFRNQNAAGQTFIQANNTWAPRLGVSWDVTGKSDLKLYSALGRYYIPVYLNTSVRLGGSSLDRTSYYGWDGTFSGDTYQLPGKLSQLGDPLVLQDGATRDPRTVVDRKLRPMHQDEFLVGFDKALDSGWQVGVRYLRRELRDGIDDMCWGAGAEAWAQQAGYTADQAKNIGTAVGNCFVYNPGRDLTASIDIDGNGHYTDVVIPAQALHMPKPERKYQALVFSFERPWDKHWWFKGSYVLSYSRGNTEGYVKSDNGQADAGMTQDFDQPGLMEGSTGYLPNDRRHAFKLFGAYAFTSEWRVGAALSMVSGRPRNCFGSYAGTLDSNSVNYGDASFWCGGQLHTRGSLGRLPWTRQLDAQLHYEPAWQKRLSFTLDVQNVDNRRGYYSVSEYEDKGMGAADSSYGMPFPDAIQRPRTVKLSGQYEF